MKKLLATILFLLPSLTFGAQLHQRVWTVQGTQLQSNLSGFTVVATSTLANLKHTSFGGEVASSNGYDHVWYSDSACTTKLSYDTEQFSTTTGTFVDWINVTSLTQNVNFPIYECWGDTTITTYQGTPTGAYDASTVLELHLGTTTTQFPPQATLYDSIGLNNLAKTSSTRPKATSTAQFGDGADFANGTVDVAQKTASVTGLPDSNGNMTISGWVKLQTNNAVNEDMFSMQDTAPTLQVALERRSGNCGFYKAGGSTLIQVACPAVDTRHRFVLTWNGTTNVMWLDNASTTAAVAHNTGAATRIYMSTFDGASEPFKGMLDEFRVSNVTRTPQWIGTQWNNETNVATFFSIGAEQNVPSTVVLYTVPTLFFGNGNFFLGNFNFFVR